MTEEKEVTVIVGGKEVKLSELKKQYNGLILAGTSGIMRLMDTLSKAEEPLNRYTISRESNLSTAYTRDILKKLASKGYVAEFQMRGRVKYYLLTDKGLALFKKLSKQT